MAVSRPLDCPGCGSQTSANECGACGAELSELRAVLLTAEAAWARVWETLAEGHPKQALVDARQAASLHLDDRTRPLFGWLLFLAGEIDAAARVWEDIPAVAKDLVVAFNRGFDAAREGDLEAAREAVSGHRVPFGPLSELRRGLGLPEATDRSGERTAVPTTTTNGEGDHRGRARRRSWTRAVAGAAVLLAVVVAYSAGRGSMTQPGAEPEPAVAATEPPPTPTASATAPAGPSDAAVATAFLSPDSLLLSNLYSDSSVQKLPLRSVIWIPQAARARAGHAWYARAYLGDQDSASVSANAAYRSALLSVGASASEYWVDDALYALLVSKATDPTDRSRYATMIRDHHSGSMFDNSVTRAYADSR